MTDPIDRYKLMVDCWSRDLSIGDCFQILIEHGYITNTRHIQRVYYIEEAAYQYYRKHKKEEIIPNATDNIKRN